MVKEVLRMNKKSRIYVFVLVWSAALLQLFINSSVNREKNMVSQVMSQGVENIVEGEISAYAYYSDEELTQNAKESIVKNLAKELGVTTSYEVKHRRSENNETTELFKNGQQGDTTIRLISIEAKDNYNQPKWENYILIDLDLKKSASQSVYYYKEKLGEICDDIGVNESTNIYLCSQKKGRLTEQEIENEIAAFNDSMDAKEVKRIDIGGGVCVYGYSREIDEFVYQDKDKVNVNIAFVYDEKDDVTYIHKGIPFVDKSF